MPLVHEAPAREPKHSCLKPSLDSWSYRYRNGKVPEIGSIFQCDKCERYYLVVKSSSYNKKRWKAISTRKALKILRKVENENGSLQES